MSKVSYSNFIFHISVPICTFGFYKVIINDHKTFMFAHKVPKNAILVLFSIFFLFFVDLMCLTETKYVPIAIFLTINTHILKVF